MVALKEYKFNQNVEVHPALKKVLSCKLFLQRLKPLMHKMNITHQETEIYPQMTPQ